MRQTIYQKANLFIFVICLEKSLEIFLSHFPLKTVDWDTQVGYTSVLQSFEKYTETLLEIQNSIFIIHFTKGV